MKITSTNWEIRCATLAEKQALFDYALSAKVPVLPGPIGFEQHGGTSYRDDADLQIGYCDNKGTGYPSGLMSFEGYDAKPITAADFRAMCDAYATR